MKKFLLSGLLMAFAAANVFGYSGGSGTEADPYQIASAADLIELGNTTADYSIMYLCHDG